VFGFTGVIIHCNCTIHIVPFYNRNNKKKDKMANSVNVYGVTLLKL